MDGAGLPDQDQEGCLKRIGDILGVAENAAADPQDHGAMALQEDRKRKFRDLIVPSREPIEQLPVAE